MSPFYHPYLDYNNADFDSMRKIFNDEFNVLLKNFTDVNDQLSYFVKTLNIAKESFIPRKKCFNNPRNHIKLDKTAKSKLRKKQRLWKQYLKTKDTKTYTDFSRTSNQLRHLTRKSAKEKERNISDQAKTNPKSFWKYVNQKRKYKVPIPNLYKSKAENKKDLAETDIDKTETLANQFSSVFTKESNTDWDLPDPVKTNKNMSVVFSENIVLEKLQNLSINKSPGPDDINSRILVELAKSVAPSLSILFQNFLSYWNCIIRLEKS